MMSVPYVTFGLQEAIFYSLFLFAKNGDFSVEF